MSSTISTSVGKQPADPYKSKNFDLSAPLKEKVEDLVKFIQDTKYGMLTTKASDSDLLSSRAMALAGTENGGIDLIFHTNLHSAKAIDLTVHPTETNMSFLNIATGEWASISGTASILAGEEIVQKFYSPALQTWLGDLGDGVHDASPSDPRIGVIRVEAKSAIHVFPRKGLVGRAVDTGKAIAKGEVPQINKIRELSTDELAQWRNTHKE
ncbi:blue light-inducible protein Bli-3 [Talaromyces proteolyticus]|uniref:Blue light-inducible protein Bli-3 n=1 Tax=Talaromyces proteolyticus TaxID=1131652 RepID=A0AAD4KTS7_9EURO|nr:blue light-inducible protein Bli-3 [Talaromyces proteolyticus]KAH8699128.1 blue light-inducible protein Bli-3 [Talaromyces proteolyticus]